MHVCVYMVTYHALQTTLYTEDWIGLKTLNKAGKVKYINVSGNHLQISRSDMKKYIVPYLEDESLQAKPPLRRELSISRGWISWFKKIFLRFTGQASVTSTLLSVED